MLLNKTESKFKKPDVKENMNEVITLRTLNNWILTFLFAEKNGIPNNLFTYLLIITKKFRVLFDNAKINDYHYE